MGFFGSLFDKKICSICGGEIGLLGNRKLEDGNLCKTCAKKLSDWFDDRRHSTVDQIRWQLEAREENRRQLDTFRPALSIGERYSLKVELENGVPKRFLVARTSDYLEENADILRFDQVTSFRIDIRDSRRELKYTNNKGEYVSYVPARYEYSYDFYAEIQTTCPYCDEIRFKLNDSTLELETVTGSSHRSSSGIGQFLLSSRGFEPMDFPRYRDYKNMCDELEQLFALAAQGQPLPGFAPAQPVAPVQSAPAQPVAPVQSAAPAAGWQCAGCGTFNGGKFCENCGSPRPRVARCDKCGWQPAQGQGMPKFCPECGDPFNEFDLA